MRHPWAKKRWIQGRFVTYRARVRSTVAQSCTAEKADTFMRTVRILSLRTTHPDNYQKAIIKALPHVDDTWAPKLPHSQRDSEMPKLTLEETQERERKAHRENSRLHLETTRFQLPIH
jgi:hypothetical protein